MTLEYVKEEGLGGTWTLSRKEQVWVPRLAHKRPPHTLSQPQQKSDFFVECFNTLEVFHIVDTEEFPQPQERTIF